MASKHSNEGVDSIRFLAGITDFSEAEVLEFTSLATQAERRADDLTQRERGQLHLFLSRVETEVTRREKSRDVVTRYQVETMRETLRDIYASLNPDSDE